LVRLGHEVVGIEPNLTKVDRLNAGESPIREPGLDKLIQQGVSTGRLRATSKPTGLVSSADLSLICVGTPTGPDGSTALDHLCAVAEQIGRGLQETDRVHDVVVRSTVFPGTTRRLVAPILEQTSQKQVGRDFGLVVNPEFMRESTALDDFMQPPYTLIGEWDVPAGNRVATLYQSIPAPLYRVSLEEAELLKVINNVFHALKIGFANEIGRLCQQLALDGHTVMDLVCADTKLNISRAYLRPGFAFGGSCLPKDLRSLVSHARRLGVEMPIVDSILPSNRLHLDSARRAVHRLGVRRVAVLGLSFKAGTDDLRESPVVDLIRELWRDGIDVAVYDPDVQLGEMLGSNREFLRRQLPQIDQIICSRCEDAFSRSEAVIVSQERPEFTSAIDRFASGQQILDLTRFTQSSAQSNLHSGGSLGMSVTDRTLVDVDAVLPS
jgi:GDP-mannose 6-dehydrogenase